MPASGSAAPSRMRFSTDAAAAMMTSSSSTVTKEPTFTSTVRMRARHDAATSRGEISPAPMRRLISTAERRKRSASERMSPGHHVGHLRRRRLFAADRLDHPPALHHHDAVADVVHVADVVIDDHHAETVLAGDLHRFGYLFGLLHRKCRCRL